MTKSPRREPDPDQDDRLSTLMYMYHTVGVLDRIAWRFDILGRRLGKCLITANHASLEKACAELCSIWKHLLFSLGATRAVN